MMLLSVPKNHEEEQARASSTFKWAFADEEDEEEEGNEVHEEVVMEGICYCLLVRRKKLRRHAILPLRHYFLPLSLSPSPLSSSLSYGYKYTIEWFQRSFANTLSLSGR